MWLVDKILPFPSFVHSEMQHLKYQLLLFNKVVKMSDVLATSCAEWLRLELFLPSLRDKYNSVY